MIWLVILIAIPLVELAVIIRVAQWIGFWPTLLIVVATFMLGAMVVGRSGFTSALKVRDALARGEPPVAAMLDSALVVVAGVLLMTPGFMADAVGLALLIPPVRMALARLALRNATIVGSVRVDQTTYQNRPTGGDETRTEPPRGRGAADGPVIEGEFQRLDERSVNRGRKPMDRQGDA